MFLFIILNRRLPEPHYTFRMRNKNFESGQILLTGSVCVYIYIYIYIHTHTKAGFSIK